MNQGDGTLIAIIDYDAGNIKSVEKALLAIGETPVLTRDPEVILQADHIILPGVGSFGDAMENLNKFGLIDVIHEAINRKIPFLGICLGLQLLFESSEETPGVAGLGILKGKIVRIPEGSGLKIPHMGWNSLNVRKGAALCTFILSAGQRPQNRSSNCRIWCYDPRISRKRKCFCLSVSPREELKDRSGNS